MDIIHRIFTRWRKINYEADIKIMQIEKQEAEDNYIKNQIKIKTQKIKQIEKELYLKSLPINTL